MIDTIYLIDPEHRQISGSGHGQLDLLGQLDLFGIEEP
jgi:hypothetical protein